MDWALTVGRLIVIITEIVAVFAFIYRFSLDEKLVELHSNIKQKQVLLSLLKQDESKYRNVQDRVALASTFSEKSSKTSSVIRDIINLTPEGIKINDLILNKDRISMTIDATSLSGLSDFVNPLKDYPRIRSVSIDNIENRPSIGLLVNITAMLK